MMITANDGFIEQSERYSTDNAGKSLKKYILLKKWELAYNHGASKIRPFGSCFALTRAANIRIPFVYHCFLALEDNPEFLEHTLNGKNVENQLRKIVSSGARMDGLLNISFQEYTSIFIRCPIRKEQDKISILIKSIDHLLTLHQSKSFGHILKVIVNCTLSWEQRKLGEIGSVAMCHRIFKYQTTESGDIPFFKIGSFGGTPDAFISKDLFESFKVKYPYPEKGDVLISASGSIGRTVVFTGKDEYFQDSNIVWLKHNNNIINSFLNYLYSIVKWAGIEGSTIKRLYNDNILKTEAIIPTLLEQQKISDYLDGINHLITLHQSKLEKLQKIKKSMLESMFV